MNNLRKIQRKDIRTVVVCLVILLGCLAAISLPGCTAAQEQWQHMKDDANRLRN